jgi:aspartate/methionine/tyrosine aminotransferase
MVRPPVAERFRSLSSSATIEMSERVRAARAAGHPILPLSSGDPNLSTDQRIIEAAGEALRGGNIRYSSSAGERGLRSAIARRELLRSGVVYDPDDIIVTAGGKFALLTALMGVISPGDEVLIPAPSWVSYGPCTRLAGGIPIPLAMLDTFDVEVARAALTPGTRAIIVNSPVNPTGRVLSRSDIEGVVALADEYNLWIIFDQVYADLVHSSHPITYPQGLAAGAERTLVVDSFSKSFGMTGWRLGSLAMPSGLAKFVTKFVQHSIYCVPTFIQAAGERALELGDELLPGYRAHFRARLERAIDALVDVDGLSCTMPDAGFFLFPSVTEDDVVVARRWVDELNIAVLPGSAFGAAGAGHLRISLSCRDEELDIALARIVTSGVAR